MSWDEKVEAEVKATETVVKEVEKPAETPETKVEEQPKQEEKPVETEPKPEENQQTRIGRAFKKTRERNKELTEDLKAENLSLKEENIRLKTATVETREEVQPDNELDVKIANSVQVALLAREDKRGRKKYGNDEWVKACALVRENNKDDHLTQHIWGADDPVEALMEAANEIAEAIEFGTTDPVERKRKHEETLRAKIRKEVEDELSAKIKARGNQPLDIQSVRAAGGDAKPEFKPDSWGTTLPK